MTNQRKAGGSRQLASHRKAMKDLAPKNANSGKVRGGVPIIKTTDSASPNLYKP